VPRFFPLARGYFIASPFGPRDGGFHAGTDFGREGGSGGLPIYACQSGTVLYAGAASGYGGPDPAGWLVIDSTDAEGGGCAEYGHLVREIGVGEQVQAGQRIAHINPDSGSNGGVPPHCHLSIMPRGYDPATKIDPLPWLGQATYPAEQPTGGAVSAQLVVTPGLGGNPNGSQLVDVGGALPNSVIRDAGYRGRAWYLARPNGSYGDGNATAARLLEAQCMGHDVYLNYERDAPTWMTEGWQAGVDAGHWIVDRVAELRNGGVQGIRVVALSADAHMSAGDLDQVVACLRGAQSVAGPLVRGIYGFVETMDRIHAEGLADFYWQCGSKADLRPWVQLYQRNNDNDTIGGVTVDCNDVMAADYGQIDTRTPAVAPTATPVLGGLVSDLTPDEQHEVLFALRDIRMQLCGSPTPGEYPGFGQLGVVNGDGTPGAPRTVVDALSTLLNVPNPYSKQLEPAGQALGFLEQRTTAHSDYWGKQVMAALASNPAVSPDVKAAVLAQLASLSITLTPKAV